MALFAVKVWEIIFFRRCNGANIDHYISSFAKH
jgi:hypothetical protein